MRRTRRALRDALIELIAERAYEKITVQEVLDRADIGRSTFYAHFSDKDALFASCFDDLRADLERELEAMTSAPAHDADSPIGGIGHDAGRPAGVIEHDAGRPAGVIEHDAGRPVQVIFEHAYRNRRVYQAVGAAHLHRLIFEALRGHVAAHATQIPADVLAEYHASGLTGLLGWWVRAGFPYGPAGIARMCREMIQPGMVAAIEHAGHGSAKMGS